MTDLFDELLLALELKIPLVHKQSAESRLIYYIHGSELIHPAVYWGDGQWNFIEEVEQNYDLTKIKCLFNSKLFRLIQ